jgi:nucleotide-binding universal stress UspA family protein
MFDKLLVAVGGHDPSFEPARVAGQLAARLGAQLTIVAVHRSTSGLLGEPAYSENLIPRLAEAQEMLERARELASAEGLAQPIELESLEGDPIDRIVGLARDGDFGMIVMGTHRRGRIGAALLGSVSAAVAARAGRPVLVVPEPASSAK